MTEFDPDERWLHSLFESARREMRDTADRIVGPLMRRIEDHDDLDIGPPNLDTLFSGLMVEIMNVFFSWFEHDEVTDD